MHQRLLAVLFDSIAPLLLLLLSLSTALYDAAKIPMLEAAVCRRWYLHDGDVSVIGSDGWVDERLCKNPAIQADVALLNGMESQWGSVLTLLIAIPYARLAGRCDRRKLLMCAAVGLILKNSYFYLVCRHTYNLSLRYACAAPLFNLIGGGDGIMFLNLWAILAEATPSELRSSLFFLISSLLLATQTVGTFASGLMLRDSPWGVIPVSVTAAVGMLISLGISLFWSLASQSREMLEQSSPMLASSPDGDDVVSNQKISSLVFPYHDEEALGPERGGRGMEKVGEDNRRISEYMQYLYQSFFSKPFFILGFMLDVIIVIAMTHTMILQQWASQNFAWPLYKSTQLTTFAMAISFAVLGISPFITARLLPRYSSGAAMDYALIRANLVLRATGALAMGFARHPFLFVPAMAVYTLGVGLLDSQKAFITAFTAPKSITTLYTLQMMMQNIANIAAGRIWPVLFIAQSGVEGMWVGLPFWFSGVLYLGALYLVSRMRRTETAVSGEVETTESEETS